MGKLRPFPGIWRAAREIAYCNGGINRYRSEKRVEHEFDRWIGGQPRETLATIDVWLSNLPAADLETICDGEETEAAAILRSAPPFTSDLLNRYFDEVC